MKFLVVGGTGTVLNLALFYLLADRLAVNPTVASIISFVVAVSSNYVLNHLWTFRSQIDSEALSVKRYLRFVSVSLAGLGVNLVVLNVVLWLFVPPYKVIAQAAGIACGLVLNFAGSNYFAFRKSRANPTE